MKHRLTLNRLLALTVVWAICLTFMLPAAAAETAATIQVTETQGTVSVTNSRGRSLTLSENMRLYNGYQVTTQESSYAWLNLDDSKLAKEDAASVVEVRKDGKKLELLVSSGNLYFNVTKPLDSDETLNIRTSSMVTGVRGTCGWVEAVNSGHTRVYVLEGKLECQVTDPVSGQSKSTAIHGGEVGNFYVYTQAQDGEYCGITTEKFSEDAINGFVLAELAGDRALCGKIQSASGLNVRAAAGNAQARLAADEAAMNQRVDSSNQQAGSQAGNVSRNPVWNGEGGGSAEQPVSTSAEELNAQLAQAGIQEVTISGSAAAPETFTVENNLEVPAGKTLLLGENVNLVVQNGAELNVAGTLHAAGNLVNNGTIDVTSGNTLRIEGQLINAPGSTIDNHASGRIVATGGILNGGTIINRDSAQIVSEGMATVRMQSGGTLRFTGGEIVNEGGGYALLREGDMTPAEAKTLLSSSGSGTFIARTGNIFGAVDSSGVYTTVNPEGYSAHLQADGYYRIEEGADGSSGSQSTITNTVYVNTPSTYTLSFDPNGGSMVSGVPVREGYTFNGWADSTGRPFGSTASVSSNMTFYAQWTQNSEGGGEAPETSYTITYDANRGTLPAQGSTPTRDGYTFLGWSPAQDGSAPYLTTITGDITLYAQWRENPTGTEPVAYPLTFDLNNDIYKTIYPDAPEAYWSGDGSPVRAGFTFGGWFYKGDEADNNFYPVHTMISIKGETTLYAAWMPVDTSEKCQITFDLNDKGVSPIAYWDEHNIPRREGYTFICWTYKENGMPNSYFPIHDTLSLNSPVTLYAIWEKDTSEPGTEPDPEPERDLVVTGGDLGEDYTYSEDGVLTIQTDTPLIIKNRDELCPTPHSIQIRAGVSANITLAGVNIESSEAAFKIEDESCGNVTVTLVGENTLTSGEGYAGLQKSGWDGTLTISGNGTLTANGGIGGAGIGGGGDIKDSSGITITGGKVYAWGKYGGAGIGGGANGCSFDTTISGGYVEAYGENGGAGIGGGSGGIDINGDSVGVGYDITISDGDVTANGSDGGAGIGGGNGGSGNFITIKGGTVNAYGHAGGAGIGGGNGGEEGEGITISGGYVEAYGENGGAGIGGGNGGSGNFITIKGGTVNAYGHAGGAGIGGGNGGEEGEGIAISGGYVEAYGENGGAGIGGGSGGDGVNIAISGGYVEARGESGSAGIGGGRNGNGECITISGGEVYAYGGYNGAGIGGGSGGDGTNIAISGSEVSAYGDSGGASIGGGHQGWGAQITIIRMPNWAMKILTNKGPAVGRRYGIGCGDKVTPEPDWPDKLTKLYEELNELEKQSDLTQEEKSAEIFEALGIEFIKFRSEDIEIDLPAA